MTISHKEEFVPMKHEIETVRSYVSILSIRHSGSLELKVEVPDELLEMAIPKLILQPIVENSILHGFEGHDRARRISITGRKTSRYVELTICDNGNGIGSDYWKGPLTSNPSKFTGIGLTNVDERVRNHYGSQYGVSLTSRPGRGVCVSITMPAEPALTATSQN
jgi:two-component system sensor histidine kinase YesM